MGLRPVHSMHGAFFYFSTVQGQRILATGMEKDIKSLFLSNVAQVVGSPSALVVDRAEGKAYLDFFSGISVANLGHGHLKVVIKNHKVAAMVNN